MLYDISCGELFVNCSGMFLYNKTGHNYYGNHLATILLLFFEIFYDIRTTYIHVNGSLSLDKCGNEHKELLL